MTNEQRLWFGANLASKSQWPFTLHEYGHGTGRSFPFLKDIKTAPPTETDRAPHVLQSWYLQPC